MDVNVDESTTIGILAGGTRGDWGGDDFTSDSKFYENNQLVNNTSNTINGNNPSANYYVNLNLFK